MQNRTAFFKTYYAHAQIFSLIIDFCLSPYAILYTVFCGIMIISYYTSIIIIHTIGLLQGNRRYL